MRLLAIFAALFLTGCALEIKNLPGAPPINFKQYSGYYSVGANGHHQLHYWFVESQNNPSTDPVLLWLTGGPGCSGLSALLEEWGPLWINPDGATLSVNPYSWNRNASILTLEAPAGVGYSYSTNGLIATSDNQTANENWEALVAFFNEFPQYKTNDFYVTGESYGGIYVPTLVETILEQQSNFHMNIKGFAIGNGCVSANEGTDAIIDFLYAHGMIDDTEWQKVKSECCSGQTDSCPFHTMNSGFCGRFVTQTANSAWAGEINPYNMYSNCDVAEFGLNSRFLMEAKLRTGKDLDISQLSSVPCMNETAVTVYLDRQDVRAALGIPANVHAWTLCSTAISFEYNRQFSDMTSRVQNAINHGLKGMIYSGDIDMACNFLMGQRFSRKLGFQQTQPKTPYMVAGQVGGFATTYGNLSFVTVRDAGHMVPTDQPAIAFHIIDAFLNNKQF